MLPLQVENVTKLYGNKTAVNGIDLRVKEGEIYGLLFSPIKGRFCGRARATGMIFGR
jgi:ABC-2 type transport system ATP-binding protein